MSNSDCTPNAPVCKADCCPLPYICWAGPSGEQHKACASCRTLYDKMGNKICRYPTRYSTEYMLYRPNKCCTWQGYSQGALLTFFPSKKAAKATTKGFTRVQGSRWNHSTTNTKLYPIISECKTGAQCMNPNSPNCRLIPATNQSSFIQSGNLFKNTDYQMPKSQLISYLARNRKYLHR